MTKKVKSDYRISHNFSPPPYKWGPGDPWKLQNGMTQEKAKAIICAFIIHTHDRRAAASILHCGTCSIGVFMTNPQTIPRSVGKRVDSLAKILRLTAPKSVCSEILKDTRTAKNDENRKLSVNTCRTGISGTSANFESFVQE